MKKNLLLLLLFFRLLFVFACDLPGHFDFIVSNDAEILYSGCYDAIHKGPHIIEYILTKERLESQSVKRPSARFTQDRDGGTLLELLIGQGYTLPTHADYANSGYDRGHMAPNADFNNTLENALSTFFTANIWPQTPRINRIEWFKTEKQTRKFAEEYVMVKVVIIVDEFSEKTLNDIWIPLNFKKKVYVMETGELIYEIIVSQ